MWPAVPRAQTVTLDEFLTYLKQSHPLFEKESLTVGVEEYSRDENLGGKDWHISSGPSFARQNPMPPGAFSPERIEVAGVNATAQRVFWKTGGRLSLSWATDYTNQIGLPVISIPFGEYLGDPTIPAFEIDTGPSKYYQNNVYLTYSQPLLQNMGGVLDRLGYDLGELSVEIATVSARENQEDFLLKMAMKFIDWVLLREQVDIATERLNLTEQQLEQAQKKRASNLVDKVDVLRSEDAVRIAEQGVVLLKARYEGIRAELAVLTQNRELATLDPDFNLYAGINIPPYTDAAATLRQNSRILKTIGTQRKILERQQTSLEEMIRPQLYMNTQLALKSGNSEFGNSIGSGKSDMGISLQLNYPLGSRAAHNRARKNTLRIRQMALAEEDAALALTASLRNTLIQLEEMEKALDLNRRQIETARLKTKEEQKRYSQGRGDLAFVIQSHDNEENARLNYAQNAALYQKLALQMTALIDQLI
ncbi:MAG: TolC family protein [Candidatus Marinimicrobia bacterium]|nr:TolC family protein [Candidatus Neomarinimicrobiota bacterium]